MLDPHPRASKIAMVADRLCEFAAHLPVHPAGLRRQRLSAGKGYHGHVDRGRDRARRDQVGFAVNPRRWVVERFFAWIGRNRRLAKDFEATIDSARAFLHGFVMLLVRRIARAS